MTFIGFCTKTVQRKKKDMYDYGKISVCFFTCLSVCQPIISEIIKMFVVYFIFLIFVIVFFLLHQKSEKKFRETPQFMDGKKIIQVK